MSIDGTEDAQLVKSSADVRRLADEILNPRRAHAIVCVTIPSWASEPLVDTAALAAALGRTASIYVMPTGEQSWELTDRLPPRLDVYGGATRIWWPVADEQPDPFEHPLFFVRDRAESPGVIAKIVDELERRGLLVSQRLPAGAEVGAVVTAVRPWGAELTLVGGQPAFAHKSQLTRAADLVPEQIVRIGQSVRVAVLEEQADHDRVRVSLRPFEPQPWQRVSEACEPGMLIEGVVDEFRNFGAFIEVYPGVRGLLHRSQITREWVSHPEDFLTIGERILVRVVSIDRDSEKLDLTRLDVGADPLPSLPLSVYPDGPPWLPEPAPEDEPVASPPPADATSPPPDDEAAGQEVDAEPDLEVVAAEPDAAPAEEAIEAAFDVSTELDELERAIEDGRELERHVSELFASTEGRLQQLRAEAAQIRTTLERDLGQARLRILEFAEGEADAVTGSSEAALAEARNTASELRELLAAAETDRRQLLERLKEERTRAKDAETRTDRLRKELRAERDAGEALRRQLEAVNPRRRFIAEVQQAWERTTTRDDRARYPWRAPVLGPEFLESLANVQGVSREKITEVCAHVVSGRAPHVPGLEVHPLRVSEVGGAPQRVREDGAKAWRCSLQVSTPAARRLHYWQLPEGETELAKVVYHDDFSIR
jgi:predicted RNA-binding protein with RPS1 domain